MDSSRHEESYQEDRHHQESPGRSFRLEQLNKDDFAGFWIRVLITLIDGVILSGPLYLLKLWSADLVDSLQSELPVMIPWLLVIAYFVLLVPRFGGTPGRLIMRTRIVNAQGKYPTLAQALLRFGFHIINIVFAVLLAMGRGTDLVSVLNFLMGWVILIDGLFVAFSVRNRAVHDMMAGTYVVYQSGLEYAEAVNQQS